MRHLDERSIPPSKWVGRLLRQRSPQARSRRAKGVAGWGLPTISSSASRRQARAAASTYARLRAMGAVISASMPPASVLILRRCAQPQPTKVKGATLGVPRQARPGSVASILRRLLWVRFTSNRRPTRRYRRAAAQRQLPRSGEPPLNTESILGDHRAWVTAHAPEPSSTGHFRVG